MVVFKKANMKFVKQFVLRRKIKLVDNIRAFGKNFKRTNPFGFEFGYWV